MTSRTARLRIKLALLVAALIIAALIPFLNIPTGGLFPSSLNGVGSMQLLSTILVTAAVAITLDLMFGYTGILSMGHALFFALGCYGFVKLADILPLPIAVVGALLLTMIVAFLATGPALRMKGLLGFPMATLALGQLLAIVVSRGYFGTGGEEGLILNSDVIPEFLIGIRNTRNLYWLALALVAVVAALVAWLVRTQFGSVLQAIRENPLRAEYLGYNVFRYRLLATVIASALAGLCGVVYAFVTAGANPGITELEFSLALILMVVLGGRGLIWGAGIGAALYTFLTVRLAELSTSEWVAGLPAALQVPVSEPRFMLGVILVLIVLFMPGGLASLFRRRASSRNGADHPDNSRDATTPKDLKFRVRVGMVRPLPPGGGATMPHPAGDGSRRMTSLRIQGPNR